VITGKGYREVTMDYTTESHTVWKDDNGRIIDLHCFEYVEDGILYDGYIFPGYTYDVNDIHDVLLLCRAFNLEIPEEYKTHI